MEPLAGRVDLEMRRILILGGAGFIGANLVERILEKEEMDETEVVIVDKMISGDQTSLLPGKLRQRFEVVTGDGNDSGLMRKIIKDFSPDTCIHLAANSDIRKSSMDSEIEVTDTFQTTISLRRALEAEGSMLDTFLFASSSAVFGEHSEPITNRSSKMPSSAYGWMKLASERALTSNFKLAPYKGLVILRFPNVTGKYQTHGVVYDLVRKLRQSGGESLEVLGNGHQSKPYCLASELSGAMVELLKRDESRIVEMNYGPTDTISVRRIVEILLDEAGYPNAKVTYGSTVGGWPGDVPNYSFKAFEGLHSGLAPSKTSEATIVESIKWALNHLT